MACSYCNQKNHNKKSCSLLKQEKALKEEFANAISFSEDEDSDLQVSIDDGKSYVWNDGLNVNCPEDLTWCRVIGELAFDFFKLGYKLAKDKK